jgi:hypothetical protein
VICTPSAKNTRIGGKLEAFTAKKQLGLAQKRWKFCNSAHFFQEIAVLLPAGYGRSPPITALVAPRGRFL